MTALSTAAFGQITAQTGAITGRITDPSGAVIPNAKITLTSELGIAQTKNSSESGDYTFPLLDPGAYRLTVEAVGFNKATVSEVRVQVTETTSVPVQLEVGAETIEVSVVAEISQINVTSATLGNVLPGSTLDKLPLSTRNFTNLLALNPATAADIPYAAAAGRGSTAVFVNGQRGTMNNLVINGVDANNLSSNNFSSVPIPSPDTIEEFRVQTSMYDASQGKSSGGNVNVITKGGGPRYHGQLYEFFRNDKLNANDFFFNKQDTPRPILRQNQFGGNFGGPVPKMANTYFFGSYQGTRQLNGLSNAVTALFPVIPAARTRDAIASAFNLRPDQISDVSLKLLNQKGQFDGWVVPSAGGAAPGEFGLTTLSSPQRFDENQFTLNGDHNFGDKHRLSMRYFQANADSSNPFGGGVTFGNGESRPIRNYLASASVTSTLSPSMVNEARLGFNRIFNAVAAVEPVKLSDIGMTRFNSDTFPTIPGFFIPGLASFGGTNTGNDQAAYNNTLHFADTFAYTRGKHSLRAGFETRFYQINTFNNFALRGGVVFATFNDFLQGNIQQTLVGSGQTYRDFRAKDFSWYFQDDYRILARLTLNLGIRYDYLGPSYDRRDRIGNFDVNRLDAATLAAGGAGLLNGYILPEGASFGAIKGTPGISRSTLSSDNKTNFAPRVGLAWDVFGNGKTSVRTGYGIYYARTSNQTLLQLITAAPFFQLSSVALPGTTLQNPFPNLPVASQFPVFPTPPALTGYSATGAPLFNAPLLALNPIQRDLGTPYAQHYNFSIQQQLPLKMSMEAGYVGSQGVRLLQALNLNQALLANAAAPIRGLTANSSRNASARTAVPGFSTIGLNTLTDNGHSSYNAFIAALTRRTGNMYLQGSYTFAKSIDNYSGSIGTVITPPLDASATGGNQLVPSLQRGLSDFDRKHRLVVAYNYDIPTYGKGFWKHVAGSWSVGGMTTFQSGLPINFICATCGTTNVYGITSGLYPQLIGDFANIQKSGNPRQFVDDGTSVFNTGILGPVPVLPQGATFGPLNPQGGPGNQTYTVGGDQGTGHQAQLFGSMPRNPGLRGPFQQQWDFYVGKGFPIREGIRLNFRSEFFNLFNHAYFANPNAQIGNPAFGRYSAQYNAPRVIQFALKLEF